MFSGIVKKVMHNTNYHFVEEDVIKISCDWKLIRALPNEYDSPPAHQQNTAQCAIVPGTVSSTLVQTTQERWNLGIDVDDFDWWYFGEFESDTSNNGKQFLTFNGLATFAQVWLNGTPILVTDNMFRQYRVEVSSLIQAKNQLVIVFRSVNEFLNQRRARPRWKTKLVGNQQMRWVRSTVLGHVDVWTPPIKAVGPWREISLSICEELNVETIQITPVVKDSECKIKVDATLECISDNQDYQFFLTINDKDYPIQKHRDGNVISLALDAQLEDIALWWPHTHGEAATYSYRVWAKSSTRSITLKSGVTGFKSVTFNDLNSELKVNGIRVFCRGTCWTVSDYHYLNTDYASLEFHLDLLKKAGINMIRVGGTMIYESDDFYQLCDQLGIMVWQDFMFASMDYPFDDSSFLENCKIETTQQNQRLSEHPCISVYCGNTDVEAQAAMYGIDSKEWSHSFFNEWLASICKNFKPDIPYFPSSPTGGTMPFHLSEGISHYWGVGAYMHSLPDPDTARVRFSSEGMGLSHLPAQKTIDLVVDKQVLFPYCNEWTKRIPRDLGAGWDFEDIREFYLQQYFGVDPVHLKRSNVQRYIQLSKVITGEVIADVFNRWRGYNSLCNGGLIWFNKDFWPCAGFGLIDSTDTPKPAYYIIARKWKSKSILINHEGLDGSFITVINESSNAINGKLTVTLIKGSSIIVANTDIEIKIEAHSQTSYAVENLFDRFLDPAYAYRFGEPQFDLIYSNLIEETTIIDESFSFVSNKIAPMVSSDVVQAEFVEESENEIKIRISTSHLLQYVELSLKNCLPGENYFHLAPNTSKIVTVKKEADTTRIRGTISALNLDGELTLKK